MSNCIELIHYSYKVEDFFDIWKENKKIFEILIKTWLITIYWFDVIDYLIKYHF